MRRILRWVSTPAILLLLGCTPAQTEAWLRWHAEDPAAAVAFLDTPSGQELLADTGTDGPQFAEYLNSHAARWEQIAWCESGGQWTLRASNRTGTYGGGLMIADYVWRNYGGRAYAGTADQASKAQQIDIAERILADVGWGAWDCA